MSPSDLATFPARRICLLKPSALGDVVQTLPLLPALRSRFPEAAITWVVNEGLAELLEGHPHLDEVLRFRRRGSWADWARLLAELRRRRFDLVLDLQGLLRTAVMSVAARAPVRVGLQTAREGAHLAAHVIVPGTGWTVPAHQRCKAVAEAFGAGASGWQTGLILTDAERAWARRQTDSVQRPLLAVHPGARWVTKRWPAQKFAEVIARAVREYGFAPVLLGSSSERAVAAQIVARVRNKVPGTKCLNLTGQTSLRQLAALLQESACVLTNDSGPMHLAAGLGVPVVGLFTCTSPVLSGPAGEQHELVAARVACAGSYRKRCPFSGPQHLACMHELTIDRVWSAFVRLVDKHRLARRAA